MNEIALTFDVDWADDPVIDEVVRLLTEYKVRSTWFITHDSPSIQRLRENPLIEVGLHPNFLQGSTQGKTPVGVMNYLKKIVPEAKVVRTHAMVYSASIARMFPLYELKIDSSICLFGASEVTPFTVNYPDGQKLIKVPYNWSDDGELMAETPKWKLPGEGLNVLCFHPIHVMLNTPSWSHYLDFKKEYTRDRKFSVIQKYYQIQRYGVRDHLLFVLGMDCKFKKLSRIARVYEL